MNKKILLVEDDENLGTLLNDYLTVKGYEMELAKDGEEGFNSFLKTKYDLLILDVMMPRLDGFNLAKKIRAVDETIPIIFLTAKSMTEDRVEGLKIGADDYLTKPFSTEELLLRINNVLRRLENSIQSSWNETNEFKLGCFVFDYNKRLLISEKEKIKLTSKESDLLRLLSLHKNKPLNRSTALIKVWGEDNYFTSRSMDVYISKLRRYLRKDESIEIANLHGSGFKLIVVD